MATPISKGISVTFAPVTGTPASTVLSTTTKAQTAGLTLLKLRLKEGNTWKNLDITALSEIERNALIERGAEIFQKMNPNADAGKSFTLRFTRKPINGPGLVRGVLGRISDRFAYQIPELKLKSISYHSQGKIEQVEPKEAELLALHSHIGIIDTLTKPIFQDPERYIVGRKRKRTPLVQSVPPPVALPLMQTQPITSHPMNLVLSD